MGEHDEAVLSFRGVAQSEARAMRLLVHCAMCLGLVAHLSDGTASTSTSASSSTPSPDAGSRIYQHLANPTTATSLHQRPEMTFLADHALRDWELLSDSLGNCEDLAMGFHSLIGSLRTAVDMPNFAAASEGRGVSWGSDDTAQNFKKTWTGSWAVPVTQEHRNHWEWTLQEKHLHAFCQTFGSTDKRTTRVADLTLRWSGSAEKDGVLMEQIREAVDVDVFPTAQRHDEMPKVWSFREQVALGDVVKFRKLFSAERFPVLDVLLQTRPYYLDILPALQTLGSVFQWQSLVRARYSRRLTKEEASRLTVREAMNDLPTNADRAEWEHALLRVQTAWKEVIPVVEEFRCLPFPKHFRRIEKLTDTHPLSFFIASDNDEGVPLLAITEWLVARQNELVRVANDARRYTAVEVSSSTLKPHDLINFSKDAMMRFLLERCVAHGHGGALQLDIPLLEAFLQTTFLKPSIQIEREPFMWLGDAGAKVEVKTALAQRPLEHEVRQRLRAEIKTASVASVCLEKVTMASAFIVKAGAALSSEQAGSTLLAEYLQNVLMESPTRCMPSSTARSEVRLCHIDDFANTLRRVMNPDPMDNVAAVYKQPLGLLEPLVQDEVQKLRDCGPLVARAMAKFAEEQLTSEEIGPEVTLVDFLAYFISSNCSEDPLSSASGDAVARFSRELQMRHWEKTFRLVQLAVEGHAN